MKILIWILICGFIITACSNHIAEEKSITARVTEKTMPSIFQAWNPIDMPDYCYFKDRCEKSIDKCNGAYPGYIQLSPTHFVACYLYEEEK